MPLFRLLINRTDRTLLIETPDRETLQKLIDSPGNYGYQFYEVLSVFLNDTFRTILVIDLDEVTDKDTIIRWDRIQNRDS